MFIYQPQTTSFRGFVQFWSAAYQYKNSYKYDDNIGRPLTAASLLELYEWKNGSKLSGRKSETVQRNFVDRLPELLKMNIEISAQDFLAHFQGGGPIWRIFYLHCWQPERFPIYDQHVHRAMSYLVSGVISEIPSEDAEKIDAYLERYLPFHRNQDIGNQQNLDKALWAFGRYLKSPLFPLTSAQEIPLS